uniref:Peptidase S1 domain-containing protein n=1 Tax=Periophthalmus magnuspinnatus TaxID=409849 RepID=A0A3B3ZRG0_9GOBI
MTAAHCILSNRNTCIKVNKSQIDTFHSLRPSRRSNNISMFNSCLNQSFLCHYRNDIAILRLADPIYDNGHVAIANLPSPGATLPNNFECVITGWGLIDFSGSVPAILQEAPIPVVEHSVCSQPDWWDSFAKETMVCAGGDGIISGCQGDSGGPLNCFTDGAWRVYGVASFAPSGMCNQLQKPTVFTRVASFMDWIYSVCTRVTH